MAGPNLPSMFGRDGGSLGSLFREIERTFEEFSRRMPFPGSTFAGAMVPKVDVVEGNDGLEVTAELPGVDEKDVEVMLSNGMLTIRGEKKVERTERDRNWHTIERSSGAFTRSVRLPFDPDPASVEARFDKGVLCIRLPKPADLAKKERRIEIKSA